MGGYQMKRIKPLIKVYILIFLVSAILSSTIFIRLFEPTDLEKVNLFISTSYYENSLQKDLESKFKNEIRKINIFSVSVKDTYYSTTFMTQGLVESDLLIIPLSAFDNSDFKDQFVELNATLFNSFESNIDSFEFYTQNGKNYGLKVYEKDNVDLFNGKIIFENDEPYFLFINNDRPNASLNPNQVSTNHALKVFFELIK